MDDLFAPPDSDWLPVSRGLARLRHVWLLLGALLAVVVLAVLEILVGVPGWVLLLVVLLGLLAVASGWTAIDRSVRSWGYAERDEDLYVKHGLMFRELVVVPYGRMQYVDVKAGPLEQAFGVASVHLHTASPHSRARIPGLPKEEASRVRDRLTSLGEAQAAGL